MEEKTAVFSFRYFILASYFGVCLLQPFGFTDTGIYTLMN